MICKKTFILFFLKLSNKDRERQKEKESFHFLLHFSKDHKFCNQARPMSGAQKSVYVIYVCDMGTGTWAISMLSQVHHHGAGAEVQRLAHELTVQFVMLSQQTMA